jgi:hypothetical protein
MKKFPASLRNTFKALEKLDSASRIQDFLDKIPMNFGETCRSPILVLQKRVAHCMEGAMLAAAALWYHGEKPLLLYLKTTDGDQNHVVALFKENGLWGAVSKTNHIALRYRDPIYKTVRELAFSYFNEYFTDSGRKTMLGFSEPLDLSSAYGSDWLTTKKNLDSISYKADLGPYERIITKKVEPLLRRAHPLERKAGKLVEWKKRK